MIDFDRLAHAVAVAREGNFSAAAATIPMSQSALTRSVQSLEREYGLQIFERGRFGARLTEEGAEFVRRTEDMLQRTAADTEALKLLGKDGDRQVRFGMGSTAAALFLPRLLPDLNASGVRYRIVVEPNATLRSLLRSGQIEFFVGGIPTGSDGFASANQFVASKVPGGKLCLLVRAGHPLTQSDDHSLASYPVAAGTFIRDLDIDRLLSDAFSHGPIIEMDNYDLLAKLASETDCVLVGSSAMPDVRPELGLVRVAGSELTEVPLDWGLVRSASRRISPIASQLADEVFTLMVEAITSPAQG